MNLADRVIQANEQEVAETTEEATEAEEDKVQKEFYVDDLGFWVEQDIRAHKDQFARYVLFRCLYLNPHLNIRSDMRLYNSHKVVKPNSVDIAMLADLPENIPVFIAAWVHKKLLQSAPMLDKSKIEVVPGLLWDMEKAELVKVPKWSYNTVS